MRKEQDVCHAKTLTAGDAITAFILASTDRGADPSLAAAERAFGAVWHRRVQAPVVGVTNVLRALVRIGTERRVGYALAVGTRGAARTSNLRVGANTAAARSRTRVAGVGRRVARDRRVHAAGRRVATVQGAGVAVVTGDRWSRTDSLSTGVRAGARIAVITRDAVLSGIGHQIAQSSVLVTDVDLAWDGAGRTAGGLAGRTSAAARADARDTSLRGAAVRRLRTRPARGADSRLGICPLVLKGCGQCPPEERCQHPAPGESRANALARASYREVSMEIPPLLIQDYGQVSVAPVAVAVQLRYAPAKLPMPSADAVLLVRASAAPPLVVVAVLPLNA
jgi:hypothetical protein